MRITKVLVCAMGHIQQVVRWREDDGSHGLSGICEECGSIFACRAEPAVYRGERPPMKQWLFTECTNGHSLTAEHEGGRPPKCPVVGCEGRVWHTLTMHTEKWADHYTPWFENTVPTLREDGSAVIEDWRRRGLLRIDPKDGQEKGFFDSYKQKVAAIKELNLRNKKGWHRRDFSM